MTAREAHGHRAHRDVPADHRANPGDGQGDERAVAAAAAIVAHACRAVQVIVRTRMFGPVARRGGVGVQPQRLGVGAHVADGEGPRRQLIERAGLDGGQVPGAHLGGVGDVLERQPRALARRLQRLADVEIGVEHDAPAPAQRRMSADGFIGKRARIERHDAYGPRLNAND
jgi:hypothetical protein